MGALIGVLSALWVGAPRAQDDPQLHAGDVRVLNLDRAELKEGVAGAVYLRHWFGTHQSTALFRLPAVASPNMPVKPALHSHGTKLAVQLAGESKIVDGRGRDYPIPQGDVILIKADVLHAGTFGTTANRILSVVTPARPEYRSEEGAAYVSRYAQPPAPAAPLRRDDAGSAVRTLFNLNEVEATLPPVGKGSLAFRHWHGEDVSVALTRLSRGEAGHLRAAHAVHGEEVTLLLRGEMAFTGGDSPAVTAHIGQIVVVPPYRAHSAQCLTHECLLLSWHTPRRDEWGAEGSLPDTRFISTGGGAVATKAQIACPCTQPIQAEE